MKNVIYNALTKEVTFEEVDDLPIIEVIPTLQPLTVEERLEQVETDTNTIIDIIAYEMGVTV